MSTLIEEVRAGRRLPAPEVAKGIRETAGVSKQRLAAELGIHPLTLTRWERGLFRPRGHNAVAYSELLYSLQRVIGHE